MRTACLIIGLMWAGPAAAEKVRTIPMPEERMAPCPPPKPSLGKRILWYVPNRVMDLLDIFRVRARVGPGLALNARMTDYGAFYYGNYNSVYLGLPGPRYPRLLRSPVGRESLSGIILAGVDATDDTRHGPEYGASEVDFGAHFLLVGAEAGVDPVEIGDFLAGLVFVDFRGDDYPRKAPELPETTSGLAIGAGNGIFEVGDKPAEFSTLAARLDYLETNVQRRVSEPLRATDVYFATDKDKLIIPPQTQMRLTLNMIFTQGRKLNFEFSPDIQLDVELPNIEQRIRIFVETARNNELPETYVNEKEDKGLNIGVRKVMEDLHLSLDAGVRARIPPEAFLRLIWSYQWKWFNWSLRPEARAFYETDDGLGSLATMHLNRWFTPNRMGVFLLQGSAKWAKKQDTLTWSASTAMARVPALLDEQQRGRSLNWEDSARAQGLRYTVFGSHGDVDKHRVSLGLRGPLYKQWIYWEVDPGLEWDRNEDYDTAYVINLGLDMLFWGKMR